MGSFKYIGQAFQASLKLRGANLRCFDSNVSRTLGITCTPHPQLRLCTLPMRVLAGWPLTSEFSYRLSAGQLCGLARDANYCDESVCPIICLSVCPFIQLENHTVKLHQIFMLFAYSRGSVLLWWRCDIVCTSGFVSDVILFTQWTV